MIKESDSTHVDMNSPVISDSNPAMNTHTYPHLSGMVVFEIKVDTIASHGVRYGDRPMQRDVHYTVEVVTDVIHMNPSKEFIRTLHDFQDIHEYLSKNLPDTPVFPPDPSAAALTGYMNEVVKRAGDRLWELRPLLQFFDDKYGQSKVEAVQMKKFAEKVHSLESIVERQESRFDELASCVRLLMDKVAYLEDLAGDKLPAPTPGELLTAANLLNRGTGNDNNASSNRSGSNTRTNMMPHRNMLTRFSFMSHATNDSGASGQSLSFDAETDSMYMNMNIPSRRESRMTDVTDISDLPPDDVRADLRGESVETGDFASKISPVQVETINRTAIKPEPSSGAPTTILSRLFTFTQHSELQDDGSIISTAQSMSSAAVTEGPISKTSEILKGATMPRPSEQLGIESDDEDSNTFALASTLSEPPGFLSQDSSSLRGLRSGSTSLTASGYSHFAQDTSSHSQLALFSLLSEMQPALDDSIGSNLDSELKPPVEGVALLNEEHPNQMTSDLLSPNFRHFHDFHLLDKCDGCTTAVNALVAMISPKEEQQLFRLSIRAYLTRQVKRILQSKLLEVGLHGLNSFLPDDVLRLSPVYWRSCTMNWQPVIVDRLNRLVEHSVELGESFDDQDDCKSVADVSDSMPYTITADHGISAVLLSNSHGESVVQAVVDNVHVELVAFEKVDQLLLALIEEVSTLVGKNGLFKNSLLIIRGWWVYETTAYIGCAMKHYVSELTLAVMVCSVFNQYHAIIEQPFHALYLFLSHFGEIDWASNAVSLQGLAAFQSDSDIYPRSLPISASHLLSTQVIAKYSDALKTLLPISSWSPRANSWNSSNEFSGQPSTPSNAGTVGAIGEPINVAATNHGVAGNASPTDTTVRVSEIARISTESIPDGTSNPGIVIPYTPEPFERRELNIVNPITSANMITDKLNSRRAKRIVKVFQMGFRNLSTAIRLALADPSTGPAPIFSFFKGICNRFEGGWRPDVPNPANGNQVRLGVGRGVPKLTGYMNTRFSGVSLLDHIWKQVYYCNFVVEGAVSESALMTVCSEILIDRGTLPVGEIGKILQELTGIANFSNRLKEKFSGLKKFLEKYPEHFVISTDHPFNPHVFLKRLLSIEDLDVIGRGIVPPQLTAKFKKASGSKKGKNVAGNELNIFVPPISGGGSTNGSPSPTANKHFRNQQLQQSPQVLPQSPTFAAQQQQLQHAAMMIGSNSGYPNQLSVPGSSQQGHNIPTNLGPPWSDSKPPQEVSSYQPSGIPDRRLSYPDRTLTMNRSSQGTGGRRNSEISNSSRVLMESQSSAGLYGSVPTPPSQPIPSSLYRNSSSSAGMSIRGHTQMYPLQGLQQGSQQGMSTNSSYGPGQMAMGGTTATSFQHHQQFGANIGTYPRAGIGSIPGQLQQQPQSVLQNQSQASQLFAHQQQLHRNINYGTQHQAPMHVQSHQQHTSMLQQQHTYQTYHQQQLSMPQSSASPVINYPRLPN